MLIPFNFFDAKCLLLNINSQSTFIFLGTFVDFFKLEDTSMSSIIFSLFLRANASFWHDFGKLFIEMRQTKMGGYTRFLVESLKSVVLSLKTPEKSLGLGILAK